MEETMFKFLKKGDGRETPYLDGEDVYDPDFVTVHYEGELMSPEYATETLYFQDGGYKVRENFNDQPYEFHMLFPNGKGKLTYRDKNNPGTIYEQYEGVSLTQGNTMDKAHWSIEMKRS